MSETTDKKPEKKTPKKDNNISMIAFIAAFALMFIILGFLVLTKDNRKGEELSEESQLENKVDVVETEDKDMMDDEDEDVMGAEDDEDEDVMEEETVVEEEEEVVTYYPDLYVHEYTLSEENPMENRDEITMHLEITNIGDADSEGFNWEWYSEDGEVSCDGDVDWLDAGEKETVECEFTYDDYGLFTTRVVVDSDDEVEESDETNNEDEIDVEVSEEEYVDLSISEYSFDPVPEKAVPFTVRIGIRNDGNVAAENFYWEWWGTYANYACREQIATLAPNSEKVVTCDYTYAGWSTYDTKAVADADDDIEETDEDNNEYQEDVVPIH